MHTPTITQDQHQAITAKLATMPTLAEGIGNERAACSMAAINLALTGDLTDITPKCMSRAIAAWIICVQDACPPDIGRDNPRWRAALPLAAGTGRDPERERARMAQMRAWMWERCLPQLQGLADTRGYGPEWARMLTERTPGACTDAARAARAARATSVAATADAAAHNSIANSVAAVADAVARIGTAARVGTARTIACVADTAARASTDASHAFWTHADPCGLLEQLIDV
jgi:hypothetical protein